MKKSLLVLSSVALLFALASCDEDSTSTAPSGNEKLTPHTNIHFEYENEENLKPHTTTRMENPLDRSEQFAQVVVNPVNGLATRDDFAFGVDASMIHDLEETGSVWYDEDGYQTDIFTLLKEGGANYFRMRLWNDPTTGTAAAISYGGGTNNLENDIEMAKRAQEVGMNILVDFHYSDFWADPDYQVAPKAWQSLSMDELLVQVEEFSRNAIQAFADAGVTVNAVQIGNEINNGLIDGFGDIDWANAEESFDNVAAILTAGIKGVRSVNDDIYTIIHLANGGSWDEFEAYFSYLEAREVPYDIIGASYYPFYHGSLDLLQNNLNQCAAKFNKPVMVMEVSYGNTTDDDNPNIGNTFNSSFEDDGGFLTSVQGQMTCLRDVVDTVVKVPNNMGLGVFYWEPCWIPTETKFLEVGGTSIVETTGGWATEYGLCYKNYHNDQSRLDAIKGNEENNLYRSTWANQGFFDYNGQALASLYTYSYLLEGKNPTEEIPLKYRDASLSYTLNRADENDDLPSTVKVETNLDAIRNYEIIWDRDVDEFRDEDGIYTLSGFIDWGINNPTDGRSTINLALTVIQNFVIDGGFEDQINTSTSDNLGGAWTIYSSSPAGEKVVKLNRKPVDVRTGTTDVNFYYPSASFSFNFGQEIALEAGNYKLTTYVMGILLDTQYTVDKFEMYASASDSDLASVDATSNMTGWANGYRALTLTFTLAEETTVRIGMRAENFAAESWGHIDDFELVKVN